MRMRTMRQKPAMTMKGIPGKVGRVRGYMPLKMTAAKRMQVASTDAEKENMAPGRQGEPKVRGDEGKEMQAKGWKDL